ncbi:MAG: methyltransferase domain-containing protein [Nocardioides sp.]|uniref:class I SAM-dependent methyltransferase n=1 Tax=Nocardioides sp. TaxID=35761 RepID=UPI0039E428A5
MDPADRTRRARSFERAADDYERWRPEFPSRLFDDIRHAAGARLDGRVLDVGAGTGRATLPLVRRGARVEVVEPSREMLEVLGDRVTLNGTTLLVEVAAAR